MFFLGWWARVLLLAPIFWWRRAFRARADIDARRVSGEVVAAVARPGSAVKRQRRLYGFLINSCVCCLAVTRCYSCWDVVSGGEARRPPGLLLLGRGDRVDLWAYSCCDAVGGGEACRPPGLLLLGRGDRVDLGAYSCCDAVSGGEACRPPGLLLLGRGGRVDLRAYSCCDALSGGRRVDLRAYSCWDAGTV